MHYVGTCYDHIHSYPPHSLPHYTRFVQGGTESQSVPVLRKLRAAKVSLQADECKTDSKDLAVGQCPSGLCFCAICNAAKGVLHQSAKNQVLALSHDVGKTFGFPHDIRSEYKTGSPQKNCETSEPQEAVNPASSRTPRHARNKANLPRCLASKRSSNVCLWWKAHNDKTCKLNPKLHVTLCNSSFS